MIEILNEMGYFAIATLFFVAIIAGIVDTIAGGGGLITLPMLLFFNIPPATALGTNRLQATIGELSAIMFFIRKKVLNFKFLLNGVVFTAIGAATGTMLAYSINEKTLAFALPVLLLLIAIYSLLSHKILIDVESRKLLSTKSFLVLSGLTIGFYNGFFGPGAGSIWILAFVVLLGSTVSQATINAKPLNFIGNLISLLIFLFLGKVSILIGVIMGLGQILGAFIGSHLVIKKGAKIIKPIFIIVVIFIAIKEIYHYFW
ncbi:hypothetical protein THERMOT_1000 [Bathymodiolus thermophilus thioautotrophic gill symbiont]|uniref:TSUP family transporter n=1 Tax=Bathymodiolus thermophilus thioautotrophic gill symbiont TaxID=2360 RepID=UPI00192CB55C|nr:TSUP family transporter [Bathymodiolus thermophilus thioautotrophic gill symbiont]CAB5499240.1 hypothetical protein THERMOT_1000 [Bathymodiolus thermophilus thioautotrophic gill symbiont]